MIKWRRFQPPHMVVCGGPNTPTRPPFCFSLSVPTKAIIIFKAPWIKIFEYTNTSSFDLMNPHSPWYLKFFERAAYYYYYIQLVSIKFFLRACYACASRKFQHYCQNNRKEYIPHYASFMKQNYYNNWSRITGMIRKYDNLPLSSPLLLSVKHAISYKQIAACQTKRSVCELWRV